MGDVKCTICYEALDGTDAVAYCKSCAFGSEDSWRAHIACWKQWKARTCLTCGRVVPYSHERRSVKRGRRWRKRRRAVRRRPTQRRWGFRFTRTWLLCTFEGLYMLVSLVVVFVLAKSAAHTATVLCKVPFACFLPLFLSTMLAFWIALTYKYLPAT